MSREINIEVLHVRKICSRCHVPYMVIYGSDHDQTCPYCSNEFYINDIVDLKKTNASLRKENKALKRSNAALKGVITKMRGSTMITPVNKIGKDVVEVEPYEVDLSDLCNYTIHTTGDGDECVYCDLGSSNTNLCESKGFICVGKIGLMAYLKFKPNIKADLESGKAVAKDGKK